LFLLYLQNKANFSGHKKLGESVPP